ncbi:MAG: hypothetical protein ACLUP9_04570 [Waltera sp.]|uniref:hypothetical protein n=1 Tax=Waltera sp. TaxID=2815806 RepID=UPI00399282C1
MAAPEGYNALGKIGISYKGDYDSNTTYERLDAVEHNGSTYLAIKDAPDGAPRDDKVNWIYLAKGFSGDIGDSEITFTEAENRENINTGESVKTVFGKIKKFFADLTAPAFAQMITSKDDLLATKVTGYVPDAKAVADAVSELNGNLNGLKFASILTSVTLLAANKQSFLGSLSDFGLPNNANVFGVFANCDWAVNVRFASNSKFYVYQIANVSHDAVFTLNFIVAYK